MRTEDEGVCVSGEGARIREISWNCELRALAFHWLATVFSYPTAETQKAQKALVGYVGDLLLLSQEGESQREWVNQEAGEQTGAQGYAPETNDRTLKPESTQTALDPHCHDLMEQQMAYLKSFKYVSPYESEYTQSQALLRTDNIADVAGFYRAFGFMVKEGGDRPDHLSAELQFMAILALKEMAACERGDEDAANICREAQKKFLAEHLGPFLPVFEERLLQFAESEPRAREWADAARAARTLTERLAREWQISIERPKWTMSGAHNTLAKGTESDTLSCPFAETQTDDIPE
ncbi:MAG: TorD/DmsD family molecular chaperone [bacterium JZ-2024 1]